ncbi:DUF2235 domain-containing protein [Martelella radicis]|uniref:Uncharacterized protein (DUF2235 family) n=1 Tax=Martelella radicis TaxID=1397476 RepID=A0A7W6KMF9_9HYPH|nr:DUF2235 domain-containing protein [Martelella radicis]MBB4123973.1 uncharacterized protein (DUF2235 family) [Martelella radicis]
MKRIVICCDGTWNRLSAPQLTNVVKFSELVAPRDAEGTLQIVYYDEGVGTGHATARWLDTILGGMFGIGLMANVMEAYRFLVFNYELGDEIYILGFSRGAYTARSLGGMIRNCGIIRRQSAHKIADAEKLYRSRDPDAHPDRWQSLEFREKYAPQMYLNDEEFVWRKKRSPQITRETCQKLKIRFIGVWDTVGALGVPNHLWIAKWFNGDKQFHDPRLSSTVERAAHAVAIDERRKTFPPRLWSNIDDLNGTEGESFYQQVWFPGDHGSVGGGGERTGLSDNALAWMADQSKRAGLAFLEAPLSAIRSGADYRTALKNTDRVGFFGRIFQILPKADRTGPDRIVWLSNFAKQRVLESPENLPEKRDYRPGALRPLIEFIMRENSDV